MKLTRLEAFIASVTFFTVLSTAFFYGCGGNKEEVKQDSTLVVDSLVADSACVDTLVIDSLK